MNTASINIFHRFGNHFLSIFTGWKLALMLLGILLTWLLIISGLDWAWAKFCELNKVFFWAGIWALPVGMFVPLIIPIWFWRKYKITGNQEYRMATLATIQALLFALIIQTVMKSLTSRLDAAPLRALGDVDLSNGFRFGLWQAENIMHSMTRGWPSGHTITSFTQSIVLVLLFPNNKKIKWFWLSYAFYQGIGVAITVHWFSDFIAGLCIGTAIGWATAQNWLKVFEAK